MGKYIGPVCRKARRVNMDLYLKSSLGKTLKNKCNVAVTPGQHGLKRKKISDYGMQLTAKQSVRFMYGVLEKQFRNYYRKAYKLKGFTGLNLLIFLECRLDNVVYRMCFASTRAEARQLVVHKFVYVTKDGDETGRIIDIPSYSVNVLDKISLVKNCSKQSRVLRAIENSGNFLVAWVSVDKSSLQGTFLRFPNREELSSAINERLIVEFYSK